MATTTITADELRRLLTYDADTGKFYRRVTRRRDRIGAVAGSPDAYGYTQIYVAGKMYKAHRLAWLYVYDVWPNCEIDHINRVRDDNRLCNLRLATSAQNRQNTGLSRANTSGVKGVVWHKRMSKWQAQIKIQRQNLYLGQFDCYLQAVKARRAAELTHHPFGVT